MRISQIIICVLLSCIGCITPRSIKFVDTDVLPAGFVGQSYRAVAVGTRLIVEVSQTPGLNVTRLETFEQDGALYVSPQRISSGGSGVKKFEVNISKFRLSDDWSRNVFWLVESYSYTIGHLGFWSKTKRDPWIRKKMEVNPQ